MAGNLIDNCVQMGGWEDCGRGRSGRGRQALLRVGDDGPGLTSEERSRAMERGERFDESVPGTGLGLAIVRDIAKLYGGSCTLAESPMGGLEVRLELPVANNPAREVSAKAIRRLSL